MEDFMQGQGFRVYALMIQLMMNMRSSFGTSTRGVTALTQLAEVNLERSQQAQHARDCA